VVLKGDALGIRLIDLVSLAVAGTILVVLLLVMRSEALAATIGTRAGLLVRRVRDVDPEAWSAACTRFRADIAARFEYGFPRSLAALAGMLLVDVGMLILCFRFVGLSRADAPMIEVIAAYLIAYPLTLFPFTGLGLVDSVVLAAVCAVGGLDIEATAIAALIVWRVFIVGGPLVLGVASLLIWRRTTAGTTDLRGIVHRARAAHRTANPTAQPRDPRERTP
jgi:uncharacterized membrane protein YbhN (UPF0104 family)